MSVNNLLRHKFFTKIFLLVVLSILLFGLNSVQLFTQSQSQPQSACDVELVESITVRVDFDGAISNVDSLDQSLTISQNDFLDNDDNFIHFIGRTPDLQQWIIEFSFDDYDDQRHHVGYLPIEAYPMDLYRQTNGACAIRTYGLPDEPQWTLTNLVNEYLNLDAPEWEAYQGSGVHVGIIDDCFDDVDKFPSLANTRFVGGGDSPSLCKESEDEEQTFARDITHGRKVMQIINAIAPQAEIIYTQFDAIHSANLFEDFGIATLNLADENVDIIVYAGNLLVLNSQYQSFESFVENIVQERNILWINAAGNFGASYIPTVYTGGEQSVRFDAINGNGVPRAEVALNTALENANVFMLWSDDNPRELPYLLQDGTEKIGLFVPRFEMIVYSDVFANSSTQLRSSPFNNNKADENYVPPPSGLTIPNSELIGLNEWINEGKLTNDNNEFSIIVREPIGNQTQRIEVNRTIPIEMFVKGAIPIDFDKDAPNDYSYRGRKSYARSYPPIMLPPAYSSQVLTVGAFDANLDDLTWYTSFTNDSQFINKGLIKPDLSAPGYIVLDDESDTFTGTSAATPIVAGVAARILEMQRNENSESAIIDARNILLRQEICLQNSNVQGHLVGRLALALPNDLDTLGSIEACKDQKALLTHYPRVSLPIRGGRFTSNIDAPVTGDRLSFKGEFSNDGVTGYFIEMKIDGLWGLVPGFPSGNTPNDEISFTDRYRGDDSDWDTCGILDQFPSLQGRLGAVNRPDLRLESRANSSILSGEVYALDFNEVNLPEGVRFNNKGVYQFRLRICKDGKTYGIPDEQVIQLNRKESVTGDLSIATNEFTSDGIPIVRSDTLAISVTADGEDLVGWAIEYTESDGSRRILPGSIPFTDKLLPELVDYPQGDSDPCPFIMEYKDINLFREANETQPPILIDLNNPQLSEKLPNSTYTIKLILCGERSEEELKELMQPMTDEPEVESTEEAVIAEATVEPIPPSDVAIKTLSPYFSLETENLENLLKTFVIDRRPSIAFSSSSNLVGYSIPTIIRGNISPGGFEYKGYFVELNLAPVSGTEISNRLLLQTSNNTELQSLTNEDTDDSLCSSLNGILSEIEEPVIFTLDPALIREANNNQDLTTGTLRSVLCLEDYTGVDPVETIHTIDITFADQNFEIGDIFIQNVGGQRYDVIGTIKGMDYYVVGLQSIINPTELRVIYGPDELIVLDPTFSISLQNLPDFGGQDGASQNEAVVSIDDVTSFNSLCQYSFSSDKLGSPGTVNVDKGTIASIFPNQYPQGQYRVFVVACIDRLAYDPVFIPSPESDEPLLTSGGIRSLFRDQFSGIVISDSATLRSGPSDNYRVINTLPASQIVQLHGRTRANTFFQIELDDGTTGWVRSSDILITLEGFDLNDLLIVDNQISSEQLYYASDKSGMWQIYQASSNNTIPIQLTTLGNNEFPSAFDGQIAFSSDRDGNREIYIMNADGTESRNISQNPADDYRPVWSPDGVTILFESDRSGTRRLYIQSIDSDEATAITSDIGSPCCVSWSNDGNRITYASNIGGSYDVFIANVDESTEPINVTEDAVADDLYPVWSPSGRQLVFQSDRTGIWQIYTVNADGTGLHQVTTSNNGSIQPTWTINGEIIYSTYVDGKLDLYIANSTGSNIRPLITEDGSEIGSETGP